ncbi:MAG: methyl-accepting chemotaxis protein [Oscillospiraceae bacterium]|nr:methyl-accepting chemotaxis protein [Oscillospiraceae bacterium]
MKSIGFKLSAIMLCVILLGIIFTAGAATIISGKTIIQESEDMVRSETGRQSRVMNEWLTNHKASVNTAAAALSKIEDYSEENLRGILKAILDGNSVYQDVYMGFPDNTAIMGSGFPIENEYSWWKATERDWYKVAMADTNSVGITDLYVDTATGDLCITVARAVKQGNQVVGVVSIDILVNFLQDIVFAANVRDTGYAFLLDKDGDIFIHHDNEYAPNEKGEFKNLADVKDRVYGDLWKQINASDGIYKYRDAKGVSTYFTSTTLDATGWHLVTAVETKVVTQPIVGVIILVILISVGILAAASVLIYLIIKKIFTEPLAPVTAFFKKAGHTGDIALSEEDIGDIQKNSEREDEIGQLIGAAAAFVGRITEVSNALENISHGDLTVELIPQSSSDTLGTSMQRMTDNLNNMFGEINSSSSQVTMGSKQVADGAQTLAQGSTEQAASIEELSSSIAEIAEKTKMNTNTADKAAKLANTIRENAEKSSDHMDEMMTAVNEINQASGSIGKVIKVIDDIAFQTNILALNAAVEAARAGQHGKGFAVVAEEVRNLAAKSAEAAKDTSSMIENSIEKATLGVRIADETAESLSKIVSGINESNQLIGEIARSSEEQLLGVEQINIGIDQVAQVVQQNSATAEESAAASEEMSSQSAVLQQLISQFKTKAGNKALKGAQSIGGSMNKRITMPNETGYAIAYSSSGDFGKY